MSPLARSAAILLPLLASACGGDPRVASFTATPVDLPRGGGEVILRWEVEGAERVSINPLIGVTESAGEATVTVGRTTSFKLVASRRDAPSAEQSITVTVEPRAVTGRVADQYGRPIDGATLVGGTEDAITDPDGQFSLSVEETPFAITARHPEAREVVRVSGLTEDTLTLWLRTSRAPEPLTSSATLSGTVTAAAGGTMPGSSIALGLVNEGFSHWVPGPVDGGSYTLNAEWGGEALQTLDLFAVQGATGLAGFTSIHSIARAPSIQLRDGDMKTIDLQLEPVTTPAYSLVAYVPEMAPEYIYRSLLFSPTSVVPLEPLVASGDLTVPVPAIADAEVWVSLVFQSNEEKAEVFATFVRSATEAWPDPLSLGEAPAPPELLNPAPQSQLSKSSPLRWTKGGYQTCEVQVVPLTSDGSGTRARFITPGTVISLNDLTEAGLSPLQQMWFDWSVRCFAGLTPEGVVSADTPLTDGTVLWRYYSDHRKFWIK